MGTHKGMKYTHPSTFTHVYAHTLALACLLKYMPHIHAHVEHTHACTLRSTYTAKHVCMNRLLPYVCDEWPEKGGTRDPP